MIGLLLATRQEETGAIIGDICVSEDSSFIIHRSFVCRYSCISRYQLRKPLEKMSPSCNSGPSGKKTQIKLYTILSLKTHWGHQFGPKLQSSNWSLDVTGHGKTVSR